MFQADALERDALDVLCLVRSVKNSFAPISRIPPEVFPLIPDYYGGGGKGDEALIVLTHVCRGWRDVLISRPSLWTRLDFENVDKTHTYIQRSQNSPLELYLGKYEVANDAFALVIPHIRRTKSLTIRGNGLPSALTHFLCHAPSLEKLDINICTVTEPVLDDALFNGDLSSLRVLRLENVVTNLPWKNLTNLRTINISSFQRFETTQVLDFLGSAPLLHSVLLWYSIPHSSDASPGRMVTLRHLRHLKVFTMGTDSDPHSTLLRHLNIPVGVSLISRFNFGGDESPLRVYLPESSSNHLNLSHITTINLLLRPLQKFTLLSGPSGRVCVLASRKSRSDPSPSTLDRRILCSFGHPTLLTTQRLAISNYHQQRPYEVGECPIFQILSSTQNLRVLILSGCTNLPFILALDPGQDPSGLVLCPNMEQLVVYTWTLDRLQLNLLINMTKNRASRGAKLSSIMIANLGGRKQRKDVFKLKDHVTHMEYRVGGAPPDWDDVADES